jgi:hypothetical protein
MVLCSVAVDLKIHEVVVHQLDGGADYTLSIFHERKTNVCGGTLVLSHCDLSSGQFRSDRSLERR